MAKTKHIVTVEVEDDLGAAVHNETVLCAALRGALKVGIRGFVLDSTEREKVARALQCDASKISSENNLAPVLCASVEPPNLQSTMAAIEKAWVGRVKTQYMNPSSRNKRCMAAQVEFFCGAMAAMEALGLKTAPKWVVCLMSDRVIGEHA